MSYDARSIKLGHEVKVEVNGEVQEYPSKSIAIKKLHEQGFTKGEIASKLNIRYQFVYNVLNR